MKYIYTKLFTALLLLAVCTPIFAQDTKDTTYKSCEDEFEYSFGYGDFTATPFTSMDFFRYILDNKYPRIDVNYVMNNISVHQKDYNGTFNNMPALEVKLGYANTAISAKSVAAKSKYDYIHISNINSDYGNIKDPANVITEGWQFGFGDYQGYGWAFSENADLILYHGGNFTWNILEFNGMSDTFQFGNKLDRFSQKLKFGSAFEAGMNFRVFNSLGLNVSYEQSHTFPAHLFWYWAGSELLEEIAKSFANNFIQDITSRNSTAGPIIYFLIKNGISYGFYELRKKNMNWPISTEAPLVFERFKIGLNYSF